MTTQEVIVPDIGDFSEVEIIEILVAVGDSVCVEDSLITVESDKASIEIPSSHSGRITAIHVTIGERISQGTLVLSLELEAQEQPITSNQADEKPSDSVPQNATQMATPPPVTSSIPLEDEPTSSSSLSSAQTIAVEIPDIGDMDSVEVIEILVAVGDTVQKEDSLITVESDKASMEIPSPHSGLVQAINTHIGEHVTQGHNILLIQTETNNAASAGSKNTGHTTANHTTAPNTRDTTSNKSSHVTGHSPTASIDEMQFKTAYASPSVRRFARELGVDLALVSGSGRKNRITRPDVKQFIKTSLSQSSQTNTNANVGFKPLPEIDFSQFGAIDSHQLSKINKITGEVMQRNWLSIPHVTQFDEADITEMEHFRKQLGEELKQQGIKVTPLAFIMKAVVATLKALPRFNSSLSPDNQSLIMKQYYHIGVAVDTGNGLVVPVIRNVDQKSVIELSQELRDYAQKARDKKLTPNDMQGGCFTISSLGGIGGQHFTPIVNAPEVAILGVSKAQTKPVWDGTQFSPQLMLPLALSYDHRVIDGADGARFTTHLIQLLGDIRRLLI